MYTAKLPQKLHIHNRYKKVRITNNVNVDPECGGIIMLHNDNHLSKYKKMLSEFARKLMSKFK